jgi:hypothetical protein
MIKKAGMLNIKARLCGLPPSDSGYFTWLLINNGIDSIPLIRMT